MRIAKVSFLLILFVLVGYGVVAYLALSVYPEKIRREQSRMPMVRAALQEVTVDQQLWTKKIREIADSAQSDGLSKVQAMGRFLTDGDLNRLALKYLGSDFSRASREFRARAGRAHETLEKQGGEYEQSERDLQRKILELNGRKKALSNDFAGRIGKGSQEWNRKWEEVENQLQILNEKKQKLLNGPKKEYEKAQSQAEKSLQELAVQSEKDTLERLRQTLAVRIAVLKERKEYLLELQRRKELISIWPISHIEESFGR